MIKSAFISLCALSVVTLPSISLAVQSTVPVKLTVEPAVIDVTVPTSLAINVSEDGEVSTADNAKITNNSKGAVVVSDVTIVPKESWELVSFDETFESEKVGDKIIGLKISNSKTTDGGFTWIENDTIIPGVGGVGQPEMLLPYDAKLPLQNSNILEANIADAVFVIDWYR